ncbi:MULTISPECIES: hypothetical protein [Pseudoalteromonas]|uniref:hypothetical protein n=1 Tax=Pseudoalteromonas TaxID=53246 RepID=UPI0002DF763A|nr:MULTISPECIES: hypothetical protein [Pseudoalteromonas]MCF6145236.1 hypothetical protein [Pseudoalteromonas mariniglutinosa NCIMB 1770]
MAQAVTVYRWDDPGAPQITVGKPAEYLDVIKKCLTTGYGSKQPLGWTVEDESLPEETPRLAIKNNVLDGGSGGVMMFSASNNNAMTAIRCQCALDYISKDEQQRLGGYFVIGAGSSGTNTANKWIVIASATAFYFIALPEDALTRNYFGTYSHILFFAGDIKSFYGDDPARFVTLFGRVNYGSVVWNGSLNYIIGDSFSGQVGYVYSLDSSLSKANSFLSSYFGNHSVNQSSIQSSTPEIRALCPILLCTGDYQLAGAGTHGNSETLPFARGEVPGLFVSQENGYRSANMPFIKNINGIDFFSVPRANSGGTNAWISLGDW